VPSRITDNDIAAIVKHFALPPSSDPREYGAHSMRSGFIVTARTADKSDFAPQEDAPQNRNDDPSIFRTRCKSGAKTQVAASYSPDYPANDCRQLLHRTWRHRSGRRCGAATRAPRGEYPESSVTARKE
jgi:hypothetical protein